MHPGHIQNLITLHANLSRAVSDGERVKLGGGVFYAEELTTLLLSVSETICRQYDNGNPAQRDALSDAVRRIRRNPSPSWNDAP